MEIFECPIDFSRYGRIVNRHPRTPPELRDKYALLDYVIQYWPWHTNQQLSETGLELNLPRDVDGEWMDRQFGSGKEILDMHIGRLPVFQKFWDLILHKNLAFEIRPWGLNQHSGVYGCPPAESKYRQLQRFKWTSLIHWAVEMVHVPLIQATSSDIMHHLYHERYHHQTLNIACAQGQSELISYVFTAGTNIITGDSLTPDLRLRILQTPYLIADWIGFCCECGALGGLPSLDELVSGGKGKQELSRANEVQSTRQCTPTKQGVEMSSSDDTEPALLSTRKRPRPVSALVSASEHISEATSDGERPSNSSTTKQHVRTTKQRVRAAGWKSMADRRLKRRRFTAGLSDDEEDSEGGYVMDGKIIGERRVTPLPGSRQVRPRMQFLVQAWKEAPCIAPSLLDGWRKRRRVSKG